jgi:hypothetical protein
MQTYQQIRTAGHAAPKEVTLVDEHGNKLKFGSHLEMVADFRTRGFIVERGREAVEWTTAPADIKAGKPAVGVAYQEITVTKKLG